MYIKYSEITSCLPLFLSAMERNSMLALRILPVNEATIHNVVISRVMFRQDKLCTAKN